MPESEDSREPQIGPTLKAARSRLGLDIRAIEDRTKIRIKYLRALENEDWEVLPGPAYVRGFLRTYAEQLGLDGEVLVDQYRDRFEGPESQPYPIAEGVLRERRGEATGGGPSRRTWPVVAGLGGLLVVVLLVLGLVGDDEDGNGRAKRQGPAAERGGGQGGGESGKGSGRGQKQRRQGEVTEPVELRISALSDVQLCVVAGGDARIDNQVLSAGTEEDLGKARRFMVDVEAGNVNLFANDVQVPVVVEGDGEPESYEVTAEKTRAIDYRGPDCP